MPSMGRKMLENSEGDPYAKCFQRVVEYVQTHLDDDLSLDRLSSVANVSKFHFHRRFSDYAGLPVGRLVRQLRLKRASWALAFSPKRTVLEIALEAGFSAPETFCRAFRHIHGQSPSQFRKTPRWHDWQHVLSQTADASHSLIAPDIRRFPELRMVAMEHHGPPGQVMDTISRFSRWRQACDASPDHCSRTFGVLYDDSERTPPAHFRFDICGELQRGLKATETVVKEKSIQGGRCAVVRHLGTLDTIGFAVRRLYRTWLPNSGERVREFPCFVEYVHCMSAVPEHEQVTDIYLPLQ